MSVPKNQHYLPQFYLEGFRNPQPSGKLQVLTKGSPYWRGNGVKETATKHFMYSGRDETGQPNHEIETEVLSPLESRFAPVLAKTLRQQELVAPH